MNLRTLIAAYLLAGCIPAEEAPAPVNPVPEWASETVWYQIFPERFRNGDPSNDPPRESLPAVVPESWDITPWTADWYAREDWEVELRPEADRTVRLRRYGGDLQGVIDRLDYLQELGVNGLYFNPLFWARSEHKYDGNTYHHIDPYFGPDPQGDFALMAAETSDPATWNMTAADALFFEMVDEAHARGIRIIIDGVFNHTGRDFFAFADLFENRRESAYLDWYTVLEWDNPETPEDEFDWKGWWNARSLPEFTDTPDGTNLHPGPKAYVFDATRKWMDPNGDGDPSDGVDGWRLDVVADVPVGFWADWNAHVRTINPDAYTVAELWEDAATILEAGRFSATMNYFGFAFPSKGFLVDGRMPASGFVEALDSRRESHRPEVAYATQNLLDSHDTDRIASMAMKARRDLPYQRDDWEVWWDYDWGATSSVWGDPEYPITKPLPVDRAVQRLAAFFQMTYVGAPMVYYGTEAGMWSPDDPDDRMPMWWGDMTWQPWTSHPHGLPMEPVDVGPDPAVYDFYRSVIALRRSHPALMRGRFEAVHTDDDAQTVSFVRELEEEMILVALNRSDSVQEIALDPNTVGLGTGEGLYEVFSTGGPADSRFENGSVILTLPPLTGAAFIRTGVE